METERTPGSRIAFRLVIGAFVLLLVSTVAAKLAQLQRVAAALAVPLLVMAGWAFIGHLATLDDDMPGGWSNLDDSRVFWRESVRDLVVKLAVLLGVIAVFFWTRSGP